MDLSIVIINHHSEQVLGGCLASIFEQPVRCACEVLLVDNTGLERGFPLMERYLAQVRLLTHTGRWGFARNCNYGIVHSCGRHVLLLNADTTVQAGALDRLVEYLDAHQHVGVAGPRLVYPDGRPQPSVRSFSTIPILLVRGLYLDRWLAGTPLMRRYFLQDRDLSRPGPVDVVIGAAMAIRRAALEQVGLLDERFFLYFEDQDLCFRMWQHGWEVHYVPAAVVTHHYERGSARRVFSRHWRWHVRSMLAFYAKHYLHPAGLVQAWTGPRLGSSATRPTPARGRASA
jgi:GT2 family glycosyltransferase